MSFETETYRSNATILCTKAAENATVIYGMDSDKTRQADECEYVEKGLSKAGYHFYCCRFCSSVLVLVLAFQLKQSLIL